METPINETALAMFGMRLAMRPFVGILYSLARFSQTGNILEIGVRQGQSTRTILGALADRGSGKLTSIDLGNREGRIPEELKPLWNNLVGDSHTAEIRQKAAESAPFDFILIDGDHSASGVKRDWIDYSSLVVPGGIVLFHDVLNDHDPEGGVKAFWDGFEWEGERLTLGTWPGLGMLRVN